MQMEGILNFFCDCCSQSGKWMRREVRSVGWNSHSDHPTYVESFCLFVPLMFVFKPALLNNELPHICNGCSSLPGLHLNFTSSESLGCSKAEDLKNKEKATTSDCSLWTCAFSAALKKTSTPALQSALVYSPVVCAENAAECCFVWSAVTALYSSGGAHCRRSNVRSNTLHTQALVSSGIVSWG